MTQTDPASFNPTILALPPQPQELGSLVAELAQDESVGVIVVDINGGTVITYPQGAADSRPELTPESITYLLSTFAVTMLSGEYEPDKAIEALLKEDTTLKSLAVFCNPSTSRRLSSQWKIQLIETPVLTETIMILCAVSGESGLSGCHLFGTTLK